MATSQSNRNLVAALSYLLGFITGVVILLVEKDDKFMKEVGRIKALEGEDLLFVYPNNYDPTRSRTTNPKKLRITEKMGYGDSAGIVDFVRKSVN